MPRIARIIGAGYPHHIIQRGNNRQVIFFDDNDRIKYLSFLKKYSRECRCKVNAYCLMNNHIHILIVPEEELSLSKTMQKLSLTYTQYINQRYNRTGRLWECRYYSSLVDRDKYLLAVCRYIEQNPVRIKAVKSALDYTWSSARANILKEQSFISPICETYDIDRNYYNDFLNSISDESEAALIKKSTMNGKPIGSMSFINNIGKSFGLNLMRHKGRPKRIKNGMCP